MCPCLTDRPRLYRTRFQEAHRHRKIMRSLVQQGATLDAAPAIACCDLHTHTTGAPKRHPLNLKTLRANEFACRAKNGVLGLNEFAEKRLAREVMGDEVRLIFFGE